MTVAIAVDPTEGSSPANTPAAFSGTVPAGDIDGLGGRSARAARHLGMIGIGADHPAPVERPVADEPASDTVVVTAPPTTAPPPPPPPPAPTAVAPPPPPPPPPPSTAAPPSPLLLTGEAVRLVGMINGYRSASGLPTLSVAADATAQAQAHTSRMASQGLLHHSPDPSAGIVGDWLAIGENVGVGSSIDGVHNAFIASPTHQANLVDAAFTQVGVAVMVGADGRVWVTEIFVSR